MIGNLIGILAIITLWVVSGLAIWAVVFGGSERRASHQPDHERQR